jgi:LmbE family N-acetylglucosaminyl deacetylase
MKKIFKTTFILLILISAFSAEILCFDTLNVIIIKAHPDEAEEYAGGTAALLSEVGHKVKFLSLTNGDVGHWKMTKKELAERRKNESLRAAEILGVTYEILPYHDGELENSIEVRKQVVRAIREWNADLVISFVPMFGGGHPDNMASGIAVQQGAGLASAPLFMPEIPVLKKRPVFLFMRDYYSKQFAHKPDIVIPIDKTIEKKLFSFDAHASQFYEFAPYQREILDEVPVNGSWEEKKEFLNKYWEEFSAISEEMREWLIKHFGENGNKFKYAEEFEIAPFSRRPGVEEILKFFPILELNGN